MQFFEQRARVLAIGERMDGVLERRGPDRLQTPPDLHPQIGRLSRKLRDQEQPRGSLCVCHSCIVTRSEEHTSELQSLMRISYAVFCLKKKNTKKQDTKTTTNHNIRTS